MITLFLQAAYQKASQNRNSNLEQMLQPPPNCSELTCAMIGKNTSRRLKLPSNYHRKVRLPESEKFPSFERVDRSFCVKSNAITKWIWPYCDIHSVASIVSEKSWWAWTHEGEGGKLLFFFFFSGLLELAEHGINHMSWITRKVPFSSSLSSWQSRTFSRFYSFLCLPYLLQSYSTYKLQGLKNFKCKYS